jgi:predicted nucleic acid-binding protein
MAVVVSDTSPIRALAHLQLIDVLAKLFHDVLVPPGVASELSEPPGSFRRIDLNAFPFLSVRAPSDESRVKELCQELDRGEAEAVALAQEVGADAVLIDEKTGRIVARRLGLAPLGTLGILLRAKNQGLCKEIRPLMAVLQSELRFFISPALRAEVLKLAGETDEV